MRGAQIVAISLIAIVATGMLIEAFNDEILTLTDLIPDESDIIILTPVKGSSGFTPTQMQQLQVFVDSHTAVQELYPEYSTIGSVIQPLINFSAQFHFVNPSTFFSDIQINEQDVNNSAIITRDLENYLPLNSFYSIMQEQLNLSKVVRTTQIIENNVPKVSSGIYLNYSNFGLTTWNKVFLKLAGDLYYSDVIEELRELNYLKIKEETSQNRFLLDSTDAIIDTLLLLMSFISVLVYLSISNLVSIIIKESKYEIRTLKSVGYSKWQIRSLFVLMSTLIGFVGSLLAILFSVVITNLVIATIVLTTPLALIAISLNFEIIGLAIATGTSVATISSFQPVFKEVK